VRVLSPYLTTEESESAAFQFGARYIPLPETDIRPAGFTRRAFGTASLTSSLSLEANYVGSLGRHLNHPVSWNTANLIC
jgi:hypothetical protein